MWCSTDSLRSAAGVEAIELGEHQSCSAPSAYTRVTSVESRLYPNKQLRRSNGAWNFGRIPRPHVEPPVFNVGASAISATNDNVDLSGEFFCAPVETSSVRLQRGSGGDSGRRTDSERSRSGSVFTQGRHEPAHFGDGFLPALREDNGIPGDGIHGMDFDDVSVDSVGRPRSGLHREPPAVGTSRTDDACRSTARADARDFPVTWPDVNTLRSRRTVESLRRSVSQERRISTDGELWLAKSRITRTGRQSTPRVDGALRSLLNLGEDNVSSSSSSSIVDHAVRLHRSDSDHSSPSLLNDNEYFISAVSSRYSRVVFIPFCLVSILAKHYG